MKSQIHYPGRTRWFVLSMGLGLMASLQAQISDAFNPGMSGPVSALAVQTDGRIIVGGAGGFGGGFQGRGLARFYDDGTLDQSLAATIVPPPPGGAANVNAVAIQPDGKILVAGQFYSIGSVVRSGLGRLHPDGTLDSGFNPQPSGRVAALALQPDGRILIGGSFSQVAGQTRSNLARLNIDGSLDLGFNPAPNISVETIALQPDGKIIVGGMFTNIAGQARQRIARLEVNGTVGTSFSSSASNTVLALALQADGKIVVGGTFTSLGGESRTNIGRLDTNGTVDASFDPGANSSVYSLAVQTDGRIIVGGAFSVLGGAARARIGRLNADGSIDESFNPGASGAVLAVTIAQSGKVLVGGSFSTIGGVNRTNVARLTNTDAATETLSYDGSTVTWLRGGASPEVWRTTFEASTNGQDLVSVGPGTRIANGWELADLTLPSFSTVRARGLLTGGLGNGSSAFVETTTGMPCITVQPASRTNNAGTVATFSVTAIGSGPLSYDWQSGAGNGATLSSTPTLTVSNVSLNDKYLVIVSNSFGVITSVVAWLTVRDPFITNQPAGQLANAGDNVELTVGAGGTTPLSYQWRKDGTPIDGATGASLTLTNVQWADRGGYDVVISNVHSVITSAVASITINVAAPDSFNPGTSGIFFALAQQTDDKVVTGGSFTRLGGMDPWYRIGRLHPDGQLDTSFNPGAEFIVYALAVQPDGKIIVGGNFSTLAGQPHPNIGRLNPDGSLDVNFNTTAANWVNCLALQADGKILVGGGFRHLHGFPRDGIGRLHTNGVVEEAFNPRNTFNQIRSLIVQPDGKILAGGDFSVLSGQPRANIGRLNPDGSIDASFGPGANGEVKCFAIQTDGKILVGGIFTVIAGQPRLRLARLHPDGQLDTAFQADADGMVMSIALQADGRIVAGGSFKTVAGHSRASLVRLEADGTVDPTFNAGTTPGLGGESVNGTAIQRDGKTLVGGNFSSLGGEPRIGIGRLSSTDPATEHLVLMGSVIQWWRGGSSPEISRASFEYSLNGSDWVSLGDGTRVPGGWELSGLTVPANAIVRARGVVTGGYANGSTWFIESILSRPVIRVGGVGPNGFEFNVTGPAGYQAILEASVDLLNWTALSTNVLPIGPLYLNEANPAEYPWRFYRILLR